MQMRFRRDGFRYADLKASGVSKEDYFKGRIATPEESGFWDATPPAQPGDVWRIFWHHRVDDIQVNDQIAGYDICCIACGRCHAWTSARNCGSRKEDGSCDHTNARSSCWQWSGSAEAGTLSASPSLQVIKEYCPWGCGWHGYITNGDIHP